MSRKLYDTKQAVSFLDEGGFKVSRGTLEVWRCRKTGPAYIKLRNRAYYSEESLKAFLSSGIEVKTVDSIEGRP